MRLAPGVAPNETARQVQSRLCARHGTRHRPERLHRPPAAAGQRETGNHRHGADADGEGAGGAQLHQLQDQAAAGRADVRQVPAGNRAQLFGQRGAGHAAGQASRVRLQGGDAEPHQPARPRHQLGGGHRRPVPQRCRAEGNHGHPRHPLRPLALHRPAAAHHRPRLPGLPQQRRGRARDDGGQVRPGQRLRLEPQRGGRRADRLGAAGRAAAAGRPDLQGLHHVAGGRVRRGRHRAQPDGLAAGGAPGHPAVGAGRPRQPGRAGRAGVQVQRPRRDRHAVRLVLAHARQRGSGDETSRCLSAPAWRTASIPRSSANTASPRCWARAPWAWSTRASTPTSSARWRSRPSARTWTPMTTAPVRRPRAFATRPRRPAG
mmetsp:Transcript_23242/g.55077  ORF Transcript_23242/g.55077 Transcript_23242/m.55077 type:complete len:376 (-) Transcript_23242:341-1468(-)